MLNKIDIVRDAEGGLVKVCVYTPLPTQKNEVP